MSATIILSRLFLSSYCAARTRLKFYHQEIRREVCTNMHKVQCASESQSIRSQPHSSVSFEHLQFTLPIPLVAFPIGLRPPWDPRNGTETPLNSFGLFGAMAAPPSACGFQWQCLALQLKRLCGFRRRMGGRSSTASGISQLRIVDDVGVISKTWH